MSMPCENNDVNAGEFMYQLSLIEDVMASYGDSHFIIGGDFNVDFCRNRAHTTILDKFCSDVGVIPADQHTQSSVDYTYQFCMDRFSVLGHFLLSGTLFSMCVGTVSVDHNIENTSDHDPIFISFRLSTDFIGLSKRVFSSRLSWVMATDNDLNEYRANLSCCLNNIQIPYLALLCNDMKCMDLDHVTALNQYVSDITNACLMAGDACIPQTTNRKSTGRIPGLSEEVQPLRDNSFFGTTSLLIVVGLGKDMLLIACVVPELHITMQFVVLKRTKSRLFVTVLPTHYFMIPIVTFGLKLGRFVIRDRPIAE